MAPHSKSDLTNESQKMGRPEANHLWIALAHSYRSLSLLVERSAAKSGLGLTDFMLLEALLHKGPLTITEIQGKILLATGSMTAAVDRVEEKGLIIRRAVDSDRRARRLELTPEGKSVIETAYRQHSIELKQWFGVLNHAERSCTFTALRKLSLHVEKLLAEETPG